MLNAKKPAPLEFPYSTQLDLRAIIFNLSDCSNGKSHKKFATVNDFRHRFAWLFCLFFSIKKEEVEIIRNILLIEKSEKKAKNIV